MFARSTVERSAPSSPRASCGRRRATRLRRALVGGAWALVCGLASSGCLETPPSGATGYVPDAFVASNPSCGVGSVGADDAGVADASGDANVDDASADGASADDASVAEAGADEARVDAGADAARDDGSLGAGGAAGGGGDAGTRLDAWVGTWSYTGGGSGVSCPDGISVGASVGLVIIRLGGDGKSLIVVQDGCTFRFSLAGDTATSGCNQVCPAWSIPSIPMWTFTMLSDTTLEEHVGGRVGLNGETCTISGTSTLTRQ
jgi:hypothetical protein